MTFAILLLCGLLKLVEPVEESVGDYKSSISRKFSSYVPAVENHFYPYGSGYGSMTSPEPIPEPFIDPSTPTNVTVIKGKSAMLACVVHHVEDSAVSWVRLRDINLLAINEVTNTKDKRIKAIHVPESDRWSLRIQDTQLSDDGPYECQVTSRQVAKVVHLKVLDPQTEISGPPEVFLSKGSTLNLTCIIRNGPASQPFIIWTHNSKILKYMSNEEGPNSAANEIVASNSGSGDLITRIVISETEVHHSGIYKCEPGAAPIASVQVHVLDGKLPAAMQTAGVGTHLHFGLFILVAIHGAFCVKKQTVILL